MRNLPPPIFLLFIALVTLGCESDRTNTVGAVNAAAVLDPAPCSSNPDPTCAEAIDFPTPDDLTINNSANIAVYGGGLQLIGGSGNIVDTDGDGVPDPADDCPGIGWRIPCDGDATNDGLYQTTYYGSAGQYTLGADINVDGKIRTADVYILMDATGSMVGEQQQLIEDLIRGTFINASECSDASDTGLVGALSCVVDDVWMGLGQFNEYPISPYGHTYGYSPYHHHLDVTDNLGHLLDAVAALTTTSNRDHPEAATQAMYSVATGEGIGSWVPNRAGCPAGRWGYPCFRPGALPVIMLFTDAEMHNGPTGYAPYNASKFGSAGASTRLPPLEQDPGMLYANNALSAHNLGDLSNKSVSVMGTNVKFANSFTTWDIGACRRCSSSKGCWGDGYDGVVRFEVDEDFEDDDREVNISTIGTFYPTTNIALLDSGLNYLDCDGGPGGGNYWGSLTEELDEGVWFAVNDAGVATNSSASSRKGPFQIRIQTTPDDPSWATKAAPISWDDTRAAILARAIKIVSIVSPGNSGMVAEPDANALGVITGSVDQSGQPYLSTIAGNGTGLTVGILDAVRALVGDTRRDITVVAEDNPATPSVDESQFVDAVVATQCPTTGINNCLGGQGTDTCEGCLADSALSFEFRVGNDFLTPDPLVDQVFDFDLISLADGSVELNRIPVRVMVPAGGVNFGEGFYENTYDADIVCEMPPERPDWFVLTWEGDTPSDSSIEFQFFTGNTLEELENQLPTSVTVTDTTPNIYVGQELIGDGKMNELPYLKVRARLKASTDLLSTPLLEGWTMQFNCVWRT